MSAEMSRTAWITRRMFVGLELVTALCSRIVALHDDIDEHSWMERRDLHRSIVERDRLVSRFSPDEFEIYAALVEGSLIIEDRS